MTNTDTPSTPPPRGFPVDEFEARTANAQQAMADRGIDAMLLTTEPEVRYFTGFQTLFWLSPTRPWFLVIPALGKPVAVIPSIGDSLMSSTWIDDVRVWSSPNPADDGVGLLIETLREFVGDSGTIGLPMGPETHIRMPAADFDHVRNEVGGSWVDTTDIVSGLRMVKSENEIAKVAHICSIVSDAFEGLPELISMGDTEQQAFAKFRIDLLQRGADDVPYLVGSTGPGGFDDIIKAPTARVIGDGDLLLFDTGSVYDGYFSDFDRNFAFGSADDETKRAYDIVWRATEAGFAAVRPGATTSDLWRAMMQVIDPDAVSAAAGQNAAATPKNAVGRMGHGLGMQVTEWPSNTPTDDTVLEEGMVLTLEPALSWAPGKMMVHEENLVVRADGAEWLSRRAAPELPILG